jgi:lipopolysaccharide export system permease protein
MLKVTTRYLAAHFIPPFVLGLLFFVAFLITFYMFRILSLIVSKGVDILTVIQMVINLGVTFTPLAVPLAAFFATIYTMNKLSEDSEIIAMRSFGMTKFRIYTPFLIVSLVSAITIHSLYSVFIPKANASFKNTILRLTSSGMLSSIKSGHFFTDIPNATLFAVNVSDDGNGFQNVFLHLSDRSKNQQRIIFAKTGTLIKIYADEWHPPGLRLHLNSGNIIRIADDGNEIEKILFNEYDFPILNANFATQFLDKDSMKTNDELIEVIAQKNTGVLQAKGTPEYLGLKKNMIGTQIELYSRYMTFPQIVLFILLGFSLGMKKGRGPSGGNSTRAIIILLLHFMMYFVGISISKKGHFDPWLATFIPCFFLLAIAAYYYKKLDWAS